MTAADVSGLNQVLDEVLTEATTRQGNGGVPGVVASVTRSTGTIYEGASGVRSNASDAAMTSDSVFAMFSTTKAVTGTTVLQCIEDGLLDLDAPAAQYVPEIADIPVLDGFTEQGEPILRAAKTPITTRMLMLHTAGFAYSFFDESYHRLSEDGRQPSVITAEKRSLATPLIFEPGTRWNYGSNMDWAGLVVESIRGKRLGEVMAERVFEPLGMRDTAFTLTTSMSERLTEIHQRTADGALVPTGLVLPQEPEVHMGGHGLYSTVPDYTRFLRMWLDDGAGEHGRVLRPETVAAAVRNGLDGLQSTMLPGVEPALSNDAEFFPGQSKSWAYTFMVNDEQAPTGRTAGSVGWAGLANLYYWIDRSADVAGLWATQILPFADPASFNAFLDFETRTYQSLT
ncbi:MULTISPECIES: serine hydrolase domain-containing protein [Tsukamurella]|uniref:Beta-lactamase family protein n=2 Tax=Tsukamurella TaxID=2060 RepID=A0A846X196_9ACTN|nr:MULTISPECIES: serine hydrolase domain-containing protein [Tsukamurella]KXP14411.1 1,4-butanediol diacrylate esterase [Tsukamurella pseudospumae]NKY19044.1 beta-lactamase family protein [Tsukamurella spumae]